MPTRSALRSRRVVTPGEVMAATVWVEDGRIAAVTRGDAPGPFAGVVPEDLGDLALLPGGVDPHVHLNDPGRADWEGFTTGTRAAAAGGVTTLGDMPLNSDPVTVDVAALAVKEKAARGRLAVDVAFHGGVVPGNLAALEPLAAAGVAACKAFLVPSGIDDFPAVGEAELRPAMRILARLGVPLLAHAELGHPAAQDGDPRRYATWLASRPSRMETQAIDLLLRLVRDTGCALHVVHLATADALPALAAARRDGLPVTVETCPHYLTFAAEEIPDGDPRYKCAPPIRGSAHREALWRALADGTIDLVACDHSPAPPAMKTADLMTSWGGIASLQVTRAATWTGARARGYGLADLARWTAEAPARLLGLADRKGAIAPGRDADLVVFDPDAAFVVHGPALEHRHPDTPYEGRTLYGVVHRTYLRGQPIYDPRTGFARPSGRVLARPPRRRRRTSEDGAEAV